MNPHPIPDVERAVAAGWRAADARDLYHMPLWADGYFDVSEEGEVIVCPYQEKKLSISLPRVVAQLRADREAFPVLIRFQDILHGRVREINETFRQAIEEFGYGNIYTSIFPIKVNQLHEVVEEVLEAGRPYGNGLECGSKAELVATLPHLVDDSTLLICNGYKDRHMLKLILAGQRLGKQVIPVIEKYDEFEALVALAQQRKQQPRFGVRIKLAASGAGRWAESGGDLSKFGITTSELLKIVGRVKEKGWDDAFCLLHFHLGSQIANVQTLKRAVKEAAQVYVQVAKQHVALKYLDVGGGLGVNYGAGYERQQSDGINYSLQEYANAVVGTAKDVFAAENITPPILLSESGRAITAHHSVLIVEALSAYQKDAIAHVAEPAVTDHRIVHDLWQTLRWVGSSEAEHPATLLEALHDAIGSRQEMTSLFSFGYLPLEQKAKAEQYYWRVCKAINDQLHANPPEWLPAELALLDMHLMDQLLCDFSVFQSVLDHWAIGQQFPIMPIAHLDQYPERRATLVDLTCDSDGKVGRFISPSDDKRFLEVHAIKDKAPYHLGFFLMGAYQDIMGDAHNLFGRVSEFHVYADAEEPDGYYIEKRIPGTTVEEMLAQVQYFPNDLQRRMQGLIREKVASGKIKPKAGVDMLEAYVQMFKQSTYHAGHQRP